MGADQRSHPADALYRPLRGLEQWAAAPVDTPAWDKDLAGLDALRTQDPVWMDMVGRGALLAAAHQSGALASLYPDDRDLALALLSGEAPSSTIGSSEAAAHVGAGYAALRLAAEGGASERWFRRLHAVACAPQITHAVPGGAGHQDHVLGHGDYKHHPNHVPDGSGGWLVTAPVDGVRAEMARLIDMLGSASFTGLHPVVRAAFSLHAVHHIRPFAAGNGRVARAVASAPLLAATSLPLLVFTDDAAECHDARMAAEHGDVAILVRFIQQRCARLVELLGDLADARATEPCEAGPIHQWRRQVDAAHQLHSLLVPAAERALDRHRARTDLGWLSNLAETTVMTDATAVTGAAPAAPPVVLSSPLPFGPPLEETLSIDAHPLSGDPIVVLSAEVAELSLDVDLAELLPQVSGSCAATLDAWLDRVVTSAAVSVAAQSN